MSRTLSMNGGSVDSLDVASRWTATRRDARSGRPPIATHAPPPPCGGCSSGSPQRAAPRAFSNHALDVPIGDRPRRLGPRPIEHPVQAVRGEPRPPFHDGAELKTMAVGSHERRGTPIGARPRSQPGTIERFRSSHAGAGP